MSAEYYLALQKCGWRYRSQLAMYICDNNYCGWQSAKANYAEAEKLERFINEFIKGCTDKLPLMKLNRWLGYIQGTLISWDVTSVQTERDWTRPLFRHLDFG